MRTIKGPAIFLAQFASDTAPFDTLDNVCEWAASLGYKGVQLPSWVTSYIDVEKAAKSKTYADEIKGVAAKHGIVITELSSHIIGQLVAVHPAYDTAFDGFAVPEVRGNPKARQKWAVQHLKWCAAASKNLGLKAHGTFSGALAWPYVYPGRSGARDRAKPSTNWPSAGCRSSTSSTSTDRSLLRDPPRRGPVRRHHLRDVPRARTTTSAPA